MAQFAGTATPGSPLSREALQDGGALAVVRVPKQIEVVEVVVQAVDLGALLKARGARNELVVGGVEVGAEACVVP